MKMGLSYQKMVIYMIKEDIKYRNLKMINNNNNLSFMIKMDIKLKNKLINKEIRNKLNIIKMDLL
jgi:hypothetical protein